MPGQSGPVVEGPVCVLSAPGLLQAQLTQLSSQAHGQMVSTRNDIGRLRLYRHAPRSPFTLFLQLLGGQSVPCRLLDPGACILCHLFWNYKLGFQNVPFAPTLLTLR